MTSSPVREDGAIPRKTRLIYSTIFFEQSPTGIISFL